MVKNLVHTRYLRQEEHLPVEGWRFVEDEHTVKSTTPNSCQRVVGIPLETYVHATIRLCATLVYTQR